MPRWLIALSLGGAAFAAFACNDETVEEVPTDVCYSGMRWVGEKRGSPEMFPGRDCVGCHIQNDGPPLAVGGTIYPYVLNAPAVQLAQTGDYCFGVEGVRVEIQDGEGQIFEVTTNRAGNFYVEGNPDDFAKPFGVQIFWNDGVDGSPQNNQMFTTPSYGGCGRCHNPGAEPFPPRDAADPTLFSPDQTISPTAKIGLPGNGPGAGMFETIEDELNFTSCNVNPALPACKRLFEKYELPLPDVANP